MAAAKKVEQVEQAPKKLKSHRLLKAMLASVPVACNSLMVKPK